MKNTLNIAIAGATGYVGIELIKLLSNHPKVKILYLCAKKSIGKSIYIFDKSIKKKNLPKITKINKINLNKVNVIFSALPNGQAQILANKISRKIKLIDLSADFRLKKPNLYKKWYGDKHKSKKLIKDSIYSIPEFSRKFITNYNIIACPGCYPTSIQLPLIPLLKKKMVNVNNIIIDAKSGYSGGGKNIAKKFNFTNINNTVTAYGVGSHRHVPEINQELSKFSNRKINVIFTPHLIPMFRGILSTIYVNVTKGNSAEKIYKCLKNYHKNNYFIKIEKFDKPIGTGDVINTNFCKISVCKSKDKNKVIILSALDNLIKGASGQAIQNMNISYKYNEKLGLA